MSTSRRQHSLTLVLAMSHNHVIGTSDAGEGAAGLPWRLPSDMAHFRRTTAGRVLVVGRRTFEAIEKAGRLKALTSARRALIVVSRTLGKSRVPAGAVLMRTLEDALGMAEYVSAATGEREVCVIGGRELYLQCLERALRIYLTLVATEGARGDALLPELEPTTLTREGRWRVTSRTRMERRPGDEYEAEFIVLDRSVTNVQCS